MKKFEIEQNAIIKYSEMERIAKDVDERLSVINFDKLIVSEENKKGIKDLKKELTKELDDYETTRKDIKNLVNKPYADFENKYKKLIKDKYDEAIKSLKTGVDKIEDGQKEGKRSEIEKYFNEQIIAREDITEYVKFEDIGLNITLSVSPKALKKDVDDYLIKFESDILACNNEPELIAEYLTTKDLATAFKNVNAKKEIAKSLEEKQTEPVAAGPGPLKKVVQPTIIDERDDEKLVLAFKVRGTKTQLKQLKEFIEALGLEVVE